MPLTLDRTLALVSPHMRGDDVKQLQAALAARGVYFGLPDGDYGPVTAAAVRDAQFRLLGYLRRKCNGQAGPAFAALLQSGKLTAAQRARVAHRVDPDTGAVGRDGRIVGVTYSVDSGQASITLDERRDSFERVLAKYEALVGG